MSETREIPGCPGYLCDKTGRVFTRRSSISNNQANISMIATGRTWGHVE